MHTVIITDQHRNTKSSLFTDIHWRLFSPFLKERGESISICDWNKSGRTIEEAVPELYEAIRGYPEWRAIIFVHQSQSERAKSNPDNPFDFECNRGKDIKELLTSFNASPLVSLTHMLAGFPPLGVDMFETQYGCVCSVNCVNTDCYYRDGSRIMQSEYDAMNEEEDNDCEQKILKNKCGGSLKLFLREMPYAPEVTEANAKITDHYYLKENRPTEVILLGTRQTNKLDERKQTRATVKKAWEFYDEEESSDFWRIYPNVCRFLCFDLVNREHTLYQSELWKLSLLLLTIATNQIPPQSLQAYQIFKVDLSIDTDRLSFEIIEHIKDLYSFRAYIEKEILDDPIRSKDYNKDLVKEQEIALETGLSHIKTNIETDDQNNDNKLDNHKLDTLKLIDNTLTNQQVFVAMKADETRNKIYGFLGEQYELDRFQIAQIEKTIDSMEVEVMNAQLYKLLDVNENKEKITKIANKTQEKIDQVLKREDIVFLSICSLVAFFLGLLPYITLSIMNGWGSFIASFGVSIISIVMLIAGGFLTVLIFKLGGEVSYKEYFGEVDEVINNINENPSICVDYLSRVTTYMHAQSKLLGVKLKEDHKQNTIKNRKRHLHFIDKDMELCNSLSKIYMIPNQDLSDAIAPRDVDEDFIFENPATCSQYEFKPNRLKGTMLLDKIGVKLYAPYSFINGMFLDRLELYDREDVND